MRRLSGLTLVVVVAILVSAAWAAAAGTATAKNVPPVPGAEATVARADRSDRRTGRIDDQADPHPCKPGWGYGDKNHEHCGPPGLDNRPETPGQGSSGGAAKPGNGKGR
jgi:hypothetical protein